MHSKDTSVHSSYRGAGNIQVIYSRAVMSGGSEERHMGAIVSHAVQIHSWSTRHRNKASQTVLSHVVQWVCHAINKSSYMCLFYSKEQGIFRPQNYLAHACCMKPGCSEMIQSVCPHTELPEIHPFSIT